MLRVWKASGEELLSMPPAEAGTVRTLKQRLSPLCGASRFRQRLLCEGRNLEEDVSFTAPLDLQLVVLPFCSTTEEEVDNLIDLVIYGSLHDVESVLQRPQDPNLVPDGYFERPVWFAAASGQVEVLRVLLEANAEVGPRERPLLAAAAAGHVGAVRLLLEAGARHEAEADDNEAMQQASEMGHLEVVRLLLEAGFDKGSPGSTGKTPSQIAAQKGHIEIVRLLSADDALSALAPAKSLRSESCHLAAAKCSFSRVPYTQGACKPELMDTRSATWARALGL